MSKKLSSLLIIVIFLGMQSLLLLHVTEYGLEKHEHHGQTCDVCLSADHNKLLDSHSSELITPDLLTFKTIILKKTLLFSAKTKLFNPRAPPFFS